MASKLGMLAKQQRSRSAFCCSAAAAILCAMLAGCRANNGNGHDQLPVAPANSRALPGSVNSADAPDAPHVRTTRNAATVFHDADTGISFQYPGAWRPLVAGGPMDPPTFTAALGPAMGSQAFVAEGTSFAKTNLIGISFSWTVKPHMDDAGCARLAADALPMGTELPAETIQGVPFHRGAGGDNGMCHHAAATLDTTLRGGRCFLFERDLETTCPNINTPGKDTDLTPAQRSELQRQLDAVMASVVLR